jgi:NAD(P) transhydrogenase
MSRDYDVIILGSGPAGFSCAMQSAKFDKKALIIEANENYLGGTWINTGTVPSKALRETASSIHRYTSQFGDEGKKPYDRFQMRDVLRYKDRVLATQNSEIKDSLIKNEVDTVLGFGRIVDPHTVEVTREDGTKKQFTADHILISTGANSKKPEEFEIDHMTVLDNRSILDIHYIPKRLVIVGASIQAMEFATIFSALGTRVTVLSGHQDYLEFLDKEIKEEFAAILNEARISVFHRQKVRQVGPNPLRNCTEVKFQDKDTGELHVIETELVLYFGDRKPNSANLGLEELGVTTDKMGFISVDENFQTGIPSIYAAGDVIGHPGLASVSFSQGRTASCHMFGISRFDTESAIPYGIYTIPEISSVGLTEDEARRQVGDVTVGKAYYRNLTKANIARTPRGLLKLVFETESLRLLGVHIVGDGACDLIHHGQTVLNFRGTARYFLDTVHNYPTYSEAYRVAAFNGVNYMHKRGATYSSILGEQGE